MFFVVFVGGGRVIDVFVTAPYCASLCASDGGFDHFRVGGRSGPSNACICKSERAVDTSLPDAATAVCVLAFLIACYAPLPLLARANDAKKSQP